MIYAAGGTTFEATLTGADTGLVGTLGVQIVDGQGAVTTARVTAGIVEHPAGSGIYTATLTAPDDEENYVVVWDDGAGTFAGEDLVVTSSAPLPPGPTTLSPTIIREHIETDLSDAALTRLINDAEAEIAARFGDDAERTVTLPGLSATLRLHRPIDEDQTVTVTERRLLSGTTQTITDYEVQDGGRTLARHNRRWEAWVDVTYTPTTEADLRQRATIDLVELAITYQGFIASEKVGDYNETKFQSYLAERERLLEAFENRRSFMRFA